MASDDFSERRSRRRRLGRVVVGILAITAIVWFAVDNRQRVTVDWFVTSTETRLIYVIVLAAILGALADRFLRWQRGRGND